MGFRQMISRFYGLGFVICALHHTALSRAQLLHTNENVLEFWDSVDGIFRDV